VGGIQAGTVTSADGTVIVFARSGEGPAVVLVPGALMARSHPAGPGLAGQPDAETGGGQLQQDLAGGQQVCDLGRAQLLEPGQQQGVGLGSLPAGPVQRDGVGPDAFEDDLGGSVSMLYVTPGEARELHAELTKTWERLVGKDHRFAERRDPKRRPADAVPVEFVLLGYRVLDSPPLPANEASDQSGDDREAGLEG